MGLKNQGATCYLNSLLQTYFHLSYFRHVCLLHAFRPRIGTAAGLRLRQRHRQQRHVPAFRKFATLSTFLILGNKQKRLLRLRQTVCARPIYATRSVDVLRYAKHQIPLSRGACNSYMPFTPYCPARALMSWHWMHDVVCRAWHTVAQSVYQMPITTSETPSKPSKSPASAHSKKEDVKPIPFALQRLFYNLQVCTFLRHFFY